MNTVRIIGSSVVAIAVCVAAVAGATAASAGNLASPATIPTTYAAGHFYAVPQLTTGQRLKLLVDTGGGGDSGMYWISADVARRLRLPTRTCRVDKFSMTVASIPEYTRGNGLPPPLHNPCGHALLVEAMHDRSDDGQLGAGYLPGRVWTFDYPARRLLVEGPDWRPGAGVHRTTLGFPRNAKGQPTSGFARITIRVGGRPVQMLLDTGATSHPTAAAEALSHASTVDGTGVASYIDRTVFDEWHHDHPTWRVVTNGDDLFGPGRSTPVIEVPEVEIAGWMVGPVWFTERPDAAFRTGPHAMSNYMDRTVDGAVGANVFRHFLMTIDYPRGVAYFQCASGCAPTTAAGRE